MSNERRPIGLVVFFLIAFAVPWTSVVIARRTGGIDHLFDSGLAYWAFAGPSVGGFVAALVDGGVPGLRRFAARALAVRVSLLDWAAAFALPLFAALLTFTTHPSDLLHGGSPHFAKLAGVFTIMNLCTGPLAEEFGWRGYLLQRLAERLRPLFVGLAIAPVWIVWHVPLFYDTVFASPRAAALYVVWLTSWSVILTLVVIRARGSVLPAVIGHFMMNTAPLVSFVLLPSVPGERQPGGAALPIASAVVACALAWCWRDLGRRKRQLRQYAAG